MEALEDKLETARLHEGGQSLLGIGVGEGLAGTEFLGGGSVLELDPEGHSIHGRLVVHSGRKGDLAEGDEDFLTGFVVAPGVFFEHPEVGIGQKAILSLRSGFSPRGGYERRDFGLLFGVELAHSHRPGAG